LSFIEPPKKTEAPPLDFLNDMFSGLISA